MLRAPRTSGLLACWLLAVAGLGGASSPLRAEETVTKAAEPAETLAIRPATSYADVSVVVDETRIFRLQGEAANIIIGNPAIADVLVRDRSQLLLTGKSFGVTNMIITDAEGAEILNARLHVIAQPSQVALFKGSDRMSLHCAPRCQQTVVIGDLQSYFEQAKTQQTGKNDLIRSAIENSGGE